MPRLTTARAGRRWVVLAAALAAAALTWIVMPPPAAHAAAHGLDLGFYDPDFTNDDAGLRQVEFGRAADAGAHLALIYADWSQVAPDSKPAGFNPTDPADPHYRWAKTDAAVQGAVARGLTVILAFDKAPSWAEGPNRPTTKDALPGTWDPNPTD